MAAHPRLAAARPLALGAALVLALVAPAVAPGARAAGPPTAAADANAVVRWNDHAAAAARASGIAPFDNPLHESRLYALVHVAIHDALNAVSRRSQPYVFAGRDRGASPEAAVAAAARTALVGGLADVTAPFDANHARAIASVTTSSPAAPSTRGVFPAAATRCCKEACCLDSVRR